MSLKLHLSLLASGLLSTAVSVNAATPAASASSPMVETIKAVRSDVSPPLSELLRSSATMAGFSSLIWPVCFCSARLVQRSSTFFARSAALPFLS